MQLWTQAMREGRWPAAWAIAEQSLRARPPQERDNPALPYHQRWVWDGRPFEGRSVLVRCYHGLGDTIQFARFLPALSRRAADVTVEAPPSLLPLLAGVPGITRLHPFDPAHPLPPAECDIEITELDLALRIAPSDVAEPYLRASRAVLPQGTVALCYGSGDWDPARNIPAELLAPLCMHAPCITLVPECTSLPVLNPGGCPLDMELTASLVAGASLVVTVDTMIAHLAGALGRPTWLLLKAEPDWRWAPDQTSSPWYPTMRLYAQGEPGNWAPVAEAIARDLAHGADKVPERQREW